MSKIIILDRDGVINKLLLDPITGLTDSPMSIEQIDVFPYIPDVLNSLINKGYTLAIATNQPAASKGKISYEKLLEVHNEIVFRTKVNIDSFICLHKSEDNCICRKPKTGLLEQIYNKYNFIKKDTWFVGDRATDIMAGNSFGLKTALLGPSVQKDIDLLQNLKINYHGNNLIDFEHMI